LFYRQGTRDAEKYWNDEAKKTYNDFKGLVKLDSDLKAAAAQAAEGAKTDDEKMAAIMSYVRKKIRYFLDSDVTQAERDDFIKKLPKDRDRNSSEILKSGIALADEMNVLVGAMAIQSGLDVRPVLVANRDEVAIDPKAIPERYFVDDVDIGMKSGDTWKLYNVSRKHLVPSMVPYEEEGMFAIVSDPKAALFIGVPVAPPESSIESRSAKLKLTPQGTLTGEVDEVFTGYSAEEYRIRFARQSPAQREEFLHDRLVRMFPDADITGLKIENVDDPNKPLQIAYHLEAPLFAQVTGKRILFHPNAFRRAQSTPFSASERRYPIEFPFAWKEVDMLNIELPAGFELENGDNPGSFDFGDPGAYKLTMTVAKNQGQNDKVSVVREFTFGAKGNIRFSPTVYPMLKKVFDEVHLRDTHSLSLKGN
jgi:hypothetical protein